MFERFTDRARRVLVLAQEEARLLNHNFIGTEHILLGLISEGEGVGAKALTALDLDLEDLRERVKAAVPATAPALRTGSPPFTPRAKKTLELALREALQLGHNYIGTEHMLLGVLREGEGVAAQVLILAGVGLGAVRGKVLEILSGATMGEAARPGLPRYHAIARALAAAETSPAPVGTHHYLLALLDEEKGVAAHALRALGITRERLEAAIAEVDIDETSDAPPSRTIEFDVGRGVVVKLSDSKLIARIEGLEPGEARRIVLEYLEQTDR